MSEQGQLVISGVHEHVPEPIPDFEQMLETIRTAFRVSPAREEQASD